jgi:hypothetical protein
MRKHFGVKSVAFLLTGGLLLSDLVFGEAVSVRHTEGMLRGFLVLRTVDGKPIASGDLSQVANGDRVNSQLVFHFDDGSLQEETVTYSQRNNFRLLNYKMVQKGPAFKHPTTLAIDAPTGRVTVRQVGDDGKEKVIADKIELPPDLANGMLPTLLKNQKVPPTKLTMLVATPKPRLVKLAISPDGEDTFSVADSTRKAKRYTVKVEIGGVSGVVAPLIGKQPPDMHVWILGGDVPAFIRSEGPLYEDGPIWRIEMASPVWPKAAIPTQDSKRPAQH